MRILLLNKFLYPNGGSETYIFKLGEYLQKMGHEVQYFGMEHKCNFKVKNTLKRINYEISKIKMTYALILSYAAGNYLLRQTAMPFRHSVCSFTHKSYLQLSV